MQPSASYPAQYGYPADNKQPYPPPQPMMPQVQYPLGNYPQQYPSQEPPPPQVYGVDATSPPPYTTTIAPQPTYPVGKFYRDWHRDICCCFNDVPFCLFTMFLPCISHCIVAKKAKFQWILIALMFLYSVFFIIFIYEVAEEQTEKRDQKEAYSIYTPKDSSPYPYFQYVQILNPLLAIPFWTIVTFLAIMRYKIRKSRNIAGNYIGDFGWMHYCCCFCATCQQYEELTFAEEDDAAQLC